MVNGCIFDLKPQKRSITLPYSLGTDPRIVGICVFLLVKKSTLCFKQFGITNQKEQHRE